jgi:STAS-like domain of unknown function (DUF4325)
VITVAIFPKAGSFAENKDAARSARIEEIEPALRRGEEVTIDFAGVDLATQSFIHALISAVIRSFGADVLGRIDFANCNPTVARLVEIVVEYSQDDLGG